MPLRRLTRFSKLELDKERDELAATIAELDEILGDEARLRKVVSDELAEVAKTYGTPRRTVLLESSGADGDRHRHAARGRRRPVLRLPLLHGLLARSTDRRTSRATAAPVPGTT